MKSSLTKPLSLLKPNEIVGRKLVLNFLSRVNHGRLLVTEPSGRVHEFGAIRKPSDIAAELTINSNKAWPILAKGSLGIGETYRDGLWHSTDLVKLVSLGARNMTRVDAFRNDHKRWLFPLLSLSGHSRNTQQISRKQISAHYDISNELFALFLDSTMSYSCGLFPTADTQLKQAQINKFDYLCQQLQLKPGMRLLEIGTGWGSLAIHAALEYGAHVTTTTISTQQAMYARKSIADADLTDQINLLEVDYRELSGTYDRVVSVEMIEAVGWRDFSTYFNKCSELLKDDGLLALQAITVADSGYEAEKRSASFINRLIFPGGCLPSNSVIAANIASETDLRMISSVDRSRDYAITLNIWRKNFHSALTDLRTLGYDERFVRVWDLYLAYCEAGFRERRIGLAQQTYAKPNFR